MIPYGKHNITQEDIDSVVSVLRSDFITQGTAVPEFEQSVSVYCKAKYAVAANSATSVLHLACLAVGLTEKDYFWTSPITFVASANCGLYCGAKIDFVDVDPHTFNISPKALEEKLIQAEKKGKLPKLVIPVHLCGQSCEMEKIHSLGQRYGFKIIEDASHAMGGKYKGEPIGNGQYSDITIFSYHPVKLITTGEGGIGLTNDRELAEKMLLLRSHGITRDEDLMNKEPEGAWYYEQIALGYNYRMTDIHAALGISQLKRLDQYISTRHKIARKYTQAIKNFPIFEQYQHPETYSSYHLYVIRMNDHSPLTRQQLFEKMRQKNIGVNVHYIPLHMQPYYQKGRDKMGDLPNAEEYYKRAISLPIFPALKESEQNHVISVLQENLT